MEYDFILDSKHIVIIVFYQVVKYIINSKPVKVHRETWIIRTWEKHELLLPKWESNYTNHDTYNDKFNQNKKILNATVASRMPNI